MRPVVLLAGPAPRLGRDHGVRVALVTVEQ